MTKYLYHIMIAMLISSIALTSCQEHEDFPDTSVRIGHVLCTDGVVTPLEECIREGRTPIAVVFHINHDDAVEGLGFAVYLHDLSPVAFADSIGTKQNTSADTQALDGNANTYAVFSTAAIGSPMAGSVFSMWEYGQSAYVPSVAQMQLLYHAKSIVNVYLERAGGQSLPDESDGCWYWTSTEVKGQEQAKAWLYSIGSGSRHETPKDESHKVRPVVTIY